LKLEIVPPNPDWPLEFERILAALSAALGPLALRIDHIGSTSVPGLAAKDIIDVQVTVQAFTPALDEGMQAAGFACAAHVTEDHRPPGDDVTSPQEWEKRLYHEPEGQRPSNIHVRVAGRANQRYPLLFRDYLRANPAAAAAYAELKRRLAYYLANNRSAYVTIKDPACDLIIAAAEAWAAQVGWQV
jgi:GrpB-like predicted nucleotidyltransferase (UPF0157 family)